MAEQFARALAGDGTASGTGSIEKAVSALDGRDGDVVVVLGRQSLAESPDSVVQAAAALAALPGRQVPVARSAAATCAARSTSASPPASCRAGSRSTPGASTTPTRGASVPAQPGLDTAGVLEAAAAGSLDTPRAARRRPRGRLPRPDPHARRARRGRVRDRGRRVRRRRLGPRRRVPAHHGVGREGRHHDQPRGAGHAPGAPHHPRRHHHGRLADRAGARGALRHRLRARHRRGRAGRDRPRRARVRGGRRRAHPPRPRRRRPPGRRLPRRDRLPTRARGHDRTVVGADPARGRRRRVAPRVARHRRRSNPAARGPTRRSSRASSRGTPPRTPAASDAAVESAADELAARPPLHRWDRAATAPAPAPPDAYSLRLVAARTLYDAGRIVSSSPSLAALATGFALVVHPSDLDRIGVTATATTCGSPARGAPSPLPVLADAATAPGTAFMPFAQRGPVGPTT